MKKNHLLSLLFLFLAISCNKSKDTTDNNSSITNNNSNNINIPVDTYVFNNELTWSDEFDVDGSISLDKWNIENETGNITHDSGGFFQVIGVKVTNTFDREVGKKGWTQPMIGKNPGGILGIIMKRVNGVPHYLLQAKA